MSLPVLLNEPLCAIQRQCEFLVRDEHLYREAAVTDDPVRRLVLAQIAQISPFQQIKTRKKKPFNPMLGETFEMVTEHYRFVGEKVYHRPQQVTAYCLEGESYKLQMYQSGNPKFMLNGGKGKLCIEMNGCRDLYFKKYDEHCSFMHPKFMIKNLIWGGNFPDVGGNLTAINHKTGEKVLM